MNTRPMIRQGDVLLVPIHVEMIPGSDKAVVIAPDNGRLILARGEATGHHHSIAANGSTALMAGPNREIWLLVREGDALLEHQEHAAHVVTGAYRVVHQREWDETHRDWRPVID